MTATTRRLWLYAVLLLLPALAVGGLSLGLLAREQARLAERETAAVDARRAAVATRARLIAENIELLVSDVQAALMATLAEAPEAEPRGFLTDWQANNPFVREVFRVTADGRPVWGVAGAPLRDWLAQAAPWRSPIESAPAAPALVTSPSFAPALAQISVPPRAATPAFEGLTKQEFKEAGALKDTYASEDETQRRGISSNVVQYSRARQEIQQLARMKGTSSAASPSSPSTSSSADYAVRDASSPRSAALDSISSDGLVGRANADSQPTVTYGDFVPNPKAAIRVQDFDAFAPQSVPAEPVVEVALKKAKTDAAASFAGRSGWMPWRDAEGLHLFGWRELADGTVIGLELRLNAIKARLGEVFPAMPESGEAYVLRDSAGRSWHEVGEAGLPLVAEVPLAASVLPGWSVAGHAATILYGSVSDGGFFKVGSALVALLVFAILAAGGLLVRQARRSEQEAVSKTSFVANVSHELKTPLTTIRLYADLLAQGRVREESKRAAYLETIGQETQRLARLVGNVLDFSRLEQGKKKYERVSFDLTTELRRLADVHAPRLAEAGLRLDVETPERLAVTTDRDAVEQIVLNLLDNACKYAASGGEVTLTLTADAAGRSIELRVADRGPGVPVEQRERIFEKFHRVDDRLTAEKSGVGLGLSIARQLARGLGGDLVCRARVDGGAEFILGLPTSS